MWQLRLGLVTSKCSRTWKRLQPWMEESHPLETWRVFLDLRLWSKHQTLRWSWGEAGEYWNQGVYRQKPETLNQGWSGGSSWLVFLSVNAYQWFTRAHTSLYLSPFLHLLPFLPFKKTFLNRNQAWAVLLPGIERSDLAEGTSEINLGFSHTETKAAQEKGFMPHYRGGPCWGLGHGKEPHFQEEPVIRFLVVAVTAGTSRVFFLASAHASRPKSAHRTPGFPSEKCKSGDSISDWKRKWSVHVQKYVENTTFCSKVLVKNYHQYY